MMQSIFETIGDYQTTELLHRGSTSLVYRAQHAPTGEAVVLKCLRRSNPTPDQVSWFVQEFEIAQATDVKGIAKPIALEWNGQSPYMVFADSGGKSLDRHLADAALDVSTVLNVAKELTSTLGRMHRKGVVHKNINPANLIFHVQTGTLALIDFSVATVLRQEQSTFDSLTAIEGEVAYVAPEQTGRVNRPIDYRSDYYSLGVTLYQMTTGRLPFAGETAMEVVHAHLAANPVPPKTIDPDLPQSLSDIILRLMQKDPEDRYRSSAGLLSDLQHCTKIAASDSPDRTFTLGEHDAVARLNFSHRLYGRDREQSELLAAFARASASSGQAELFMVGGFSGIGKTALVREIKAPVTLKRGLFIGGKFDPYRRDVPFSGVAQALKHLVNLILSDSDVEQDWQQCIAGALGSHGRVLQDMLPEITQLIGPQPDLPEMTQAEAQSLTTRVLVDFVRTVASTGRPLVIFLDDLQWVDAASINLLNALMAAPDMGQLLLVTAFRSNEIDGAHRFTQFREDTAARRGEIPSIDLPPLSVESVAEMLGDAMGCSRARVGDLAALARQATAGNPFFLQQFLTQLSRDHLLRFDADQKAWTWDLQEISAQNLVDNVADLMASEIGRADCHTRAALEIAACMGTRFELRALAKISGLTVQQIADRMWPAFENGWVLPIGRQHRLMRLSRYAIPNDLTIDCRFSHDRVHQAVYDRIVPAERAANHWQIGQGLLEGLDDSVDGNLVLHIASHLNLGGDEVSRAENRQDLQKVNLAAGQRAKTVGAHAASLEYFENGLYLRRAGDWQDQPGLVRLLLQGGAEAAYLNGDPEKTTRWTQELLDNAETTTDRTIALEIRIRSTLLTEGQQAAVSLGLEALKELGVALPTMPARSDMDAAIEAVERAVGGRDVASLSDLPLMTDPGDLATMRLFHSMLSATYASSPDLFVVLTSRMVELSIERGLSSMSIVAFADFAIVLCGRRDEFELGYAYGRLSLGLIEKLSARDVEARVTFMFYSFVHHWTEHLSGAFAPLRDAFQTGMDTGDAQYAAMSAFDYGFNLFWLGGPLAHADKEMLRFDEGILSTGQDWIRMLHLMYRQAVASLTSTSRVDASLSGEHLDAEAMIPKLEASKSSNALVQIRILRLMLNYLFGSYRVAVREAQAARDHLSGVAATAAIPGYHFYAVLAELAAAQDGAVAIKAEHLVTSRALLKLWAERSPANYRHKHLLVEAEIAGIEGRFNDARDLYDQAIDLARENGFLLEEALACERAGRFYLTNGRKRQARHYLADAHDNWQHCGAHAKVRSLETEIDQLLERTGANLSQSGRGLTTTELDFSSVLRATQAISSEIVLPKLLQTLMTALIENAGATRGVLVLRTATDWEIAADGRAEAQIVTVRATDDDRADRDADGAPLSVVEAVSQTREDLIVHDARDHDLLMADPYAQRVQPKAVLFYPIEMQSSVIGVLYLENSLMTGAFSKQRLEVLKPLCAQAAISIENAKLHKHQVNLTESANRFVPSRLANVLGRESLADVQLGDHAERDMALAVTDIRGFTSIAENLSPQEVFEFVNAYVQATDPALRENNGIVVKYMGDSQMAVFPDKAEDAMAAAIAVCRRLDEFNAGQRGADRPPISIGIGLHVGYTMLGIVGEAQRCQLDILSDSVNLVARIEKLTRTFGSNTLLSDAVLARLRADHDFETRYLGRAQIKGRRDAVGLHELIDAEAPEQQFLRTATRPVFEAAVTSMFDEDLPAARDAFVEVLNQNPGDQAARAYVLRIDQRLKTHSNSGLPMLEAL